MNEPKPRKRGGARSCHSKNGAPKTAFATKKLAERAIPTTSRGLRPYACEKHGWHLGHGKR
ncbi:MAG TPA: hypothetical protein VGC72_00060 [Candidatus Elarobacter sp.]